jgi:hypothetical protein
MICRPGGLRFRLRLQLECLDVLTGQPANDFPLFWSEHNTNWLLLFLFFWHSVSGVGVIDNRRA